MKTYENMKTSTVFWLGKIPDHWEERFLEQTCYEKCEKNIGNVESNVLSLSYGYIIKKKNVYSGLVAKDFSTYQIVNNGDIILRFTDLQNDHKSLRTGLVTQTGIITSAYTCIVPTINSAYLRYLLHAYDLRKVFYGMGGGVRQSIGYKDVRHMTVIVPTKDEQEQIVRFLDWKTSEINNLIKIKKRRLAIVQELIDKQFRLLSSKATQKSRLKYMVDLCQDFIEINPTEYYYKTGMYNRGRGIFRREAMIGEDMGDSSFQEIHSGCVMISGQFAWEAATYVTAKEDEEGVASHRYYLLKPNSSLPSEYIWAFLISDYGQMLMKSCSHGAAGRNRPLNIKELLNEYIPVPNNTNEKEMNSLINSVKEMMRLRKATIKEEQLLTEMCSSLIYDVVTGKIDVRGIEIPEYEYTAEEADPDSEAEDDEMEEGDDEV